MAMMTEMEFQLLRSIEKLLREIRDELKRNNPASAISNYIEAKNRIACNCKSPFSSTTGCPIHGVQT